MQPVVYALVKGDEVLLFPLTMEDITQRNAPNELYLRCYYDAPSRRPVPKLSQTVKQSPRLLGAAVYVDEVLETKGIDDLFVHLHEVATAVDGEGKQYLKLSLITNEVFQAFEETIKYHVQKKMDDFATTRGYDDLKSVCNYTSSTILKYKKEAEHCVNIRDLTWTILHSHLKGVIVGSIPVPTKWDDIASALPPLDWGNLLWTDE